MELTDFYWIILTKLKFLDPPKGTCEREVHFSTRYLGTAHQKSYKGMEGGGGGSEGWVRYKKNVMQGKLKRKKIHAKQAAHNNKYINSVFTRF